MANACKSSPELKVWLVETVIMSLDHTVSSIVAGTIFSGQKGSIN